MIPYNSKKNNALIKELKFALKSLREWQNSAKIYPRANLLEKTGSRWTTQNTLKPWLDNEYQQTFQIFLHWEGGQFQYNPSIRLYFTNNNLTQTLIQSFSTHSKVHI